METSYVIWNYLKGKGLSDYAVAGVMGNLYAESGLRSDILQHYYQKDLGMTSEEYTQAVNNGSYKNFVRDMAGYGLAQWTFWSRKQGLLDLAKKRNVSIGNLETQLDFLWGELQEFGLVGKLNNCSTIKEASDIMLVDFEKPYDQSDAVKNARALYSQAYYSQYHYTDFPAVPDKPEVTSNTFYCIELGTYQYKSDAESKLISAHAAGFKEAYLVTVHRD